MAVFKKIKDRNHTLYLIEMHEPSRIEFGSKTTFLDASNILRSAEAHDFDRGYKGGNGPALAQAVSQAIEYADYVGNHATPENLHEFNTSNYTFFTRDIRQKKSETGRGKTKNVRTPVSV